MKWSLTSLSTYEKCPAQYKFRYMDNIPTPPTGGAAARGTEIHAAFEGYLTGKLPTLPEEFNFYTGLLNELRAKETYPEHTICLTREWTPTAATADDRWYKGILDVKAFERGKTTEATVIDWKTGKIYPEHQDQKSLYSLAVFAEHPDVQRVRAQHVYVDLGKTRETIYDREQMHELRAAWDTRVLKLEKEKEWIPNPSFKCRFCPYSKDKSGPCRF